MDSFSDFTRAIINDYQQYGHIVNEEWNIACIFYALCSKEFKKKFRLHTIIQNLSGAGKSTLADALIRPFKQVCKEEVIEISRFTGPALQRYGSFDRKILYHSQVFSDEPQTVLPLLSEGRIGLMVVERDDNNKFVTKTYNLEGMPCFLSTTVIQPDPQMTRRVIQRTVDESTAQTRAVMESQAREFEELETPSIKNFLFTQSVISRVRDARLYDMIDRVIIPYARKLEQQIPDNLEMRSNFPKFLKLISSVCLVKSACYRGFYSIKTDVDPPLKEGLAQRIAIANLEDFTDAYKMAGKGFFQPLSAAQSEMLEYLGNQVGENQLDGSAEYRKVSTKELMHGLRWSRPYVSQISTQLADFGLISKEQVDEGGRKHSEMQFIQEPLEIMNFDVGDSTPEAWLEGKSYTKIEVDDPLEVAT